MNQRLERILVKLAQRFAPQLVYPGWQGTTDNLKRLARGLADYEFLVVMGKVPDRLMHERDTHIQNWANTYAKFHNLMTHNLFPNYSMLNASFADDAMPPVVVFQAKISPVVEAMAGFLVPYVASRQSYTRVQESEMKELMDVILARLATDDLSEPVYHMLVKDGIACVRRLIELPMQHIALTDFDRSVFAQVQKPPNLPRTGELPKIVTSAAVVQPVVTQPAVQSTLEPVVSPPVAQPQRTVRQTQPLPPMPEVDSERIEFKLEQLEEIEQSPLTPTERMFIRPVNLTFDRKPPVPDLPGGKNGGKSE